MEVYKPLLVWLSILFIIGALLNILVAPFVVLSSTTTNTYQDTVNNNITAEFNSSITGSTNIVSSQSASFISQQITLFNYIPSEITIPFFIIGGILIILTLLNLIPFVG